MRSPKYRPLYKNFYKITFVPCLKISCLDPKSFKIGEFLAKLHPIFKNGIFGAPQKLKIESVL